MQITDVNNIRFRDNGYRRTRHPLSENTVLFQLVIQGCPADAEYPGRTGTVAVGSLKRGKNQLLFLLLFRQDRHLLLSHIQVQLQGLYGYPAALGEHDRALDRILQFPDIPRPGVLLQCGSRQPLEAVDLLTVLYGKMLQEESGERKDVLPAFRK